MDLYILDQPSISQKYFLQSTFQSFLTVQRKDRRMVNLRTIHFKYKTIRCVKRLFYRTVKLLVVRSSKALIHACSTWAFESVPSHSSHNRSSLWKTPFFLNRILVHCLDLTYQDKAKATYNVPLSLASRPQRSLKFPIMGMAGIWRSIWNSPICMVYLCEFG